MNNRYKVLARLRMERSLSKSKCAKRFTRLKASFPNWKMAIKNFRLVHSIPTQPRLVFRLPPYSNVF